MPPQTVIMRHPTRPTHPYGGHCLGGAIDRSHAISGPRVQEGGMSTTESVTALAESESRFRALCEKSLAGIYIVQDGCLKYANAAMA